MPLIPEFHWCQSLVPVGFNIVHVLFVCRQLTPETGTGYWYQKTGQCVWPFSPVSIFLSLSLCLRVCVCVCVCAYNALICESLDLDSSFWYAGTSSASRGQVACQGHRVKVKVIGAKKGVCVSQLLQSESRESWQSPTYVHNVVYRTQSAVMADFLADLVAEENSVSVHILFASCLPSTGRQSCIIFVSSLRRIAVTFESFPAGTFLFIITTL